MDASNRPTPVVPVEPSRSGRQVRYRCPYCKTTHVRGNPNGDRALDRASHCHDRGSPHYGRTVELRSTE